MKVNLPEDINNPISEAIDSAKQAIQDATDSSKR
jgi:hypothetical protein